MVHVGSGISMGHYYALVKNQGKWIKCNDTKMEVVEDKEIQIYYGAVPLNDNRRADWACAYMLLYETCGESE